MANSYFQFKQFTVHQERCAMKVGTDGTLLGAWAHGGQQILDIGTGTGLIALMMAQRFPESNITAIEIDGEACKQASENVAASPFHNRISVNHASLQQYCNNNMLEADSQGLRGKYYFDAIVCNPPFFVNSLKAPDKHRSMARHADTLTYAELFYRVSELLAEEGEFSAIVPFDCREAFVSEALLHDLHLTRLCSVRTTPRKQPRRYLLAFGWRNASEVEQTEGVIEDAPNVKSAWYAALTQEFYL